MVKRMKILKKGLVYGFEAMFAGLIIMLYVATIFNDVFNFERNDERVILERKSIMSFINMLNSNKDFIKFLKKGEEETVTFLSYFMKPITSYDITIYGKPKSKPIIAFYKPLEESIMTHYIDYEYKDSNYCWSVLENAGFTILGEVKCKEGYFKDRKKYLLLNIPVGEKDVFYLYIDFNNDGKYNGRDNEGPFLENRIALDTTTGNYYYIDKLTDLNQTYFAFMIDADDIQTIKFFKHEVITEIDNLTIYPRISYFNELTNLDEKDVIIINRSINKSLTEKILKYFYNGGNVIITRNAKATEILSKLKLEPSKLYYTIVSLPYIEIRNMEVDIENKKQVFENYIIESFYDNTKVKIYLMEPDPSCSYDDLQPYEMINFSHINLSIPYRVAVTFNSGSKTLYVDYDNDCNFDEEPDNKSINIGDIFYIEGVGLNLVDINEKYLIVKPYNGKIIRKETVEDTLVFKGENLKSFSLIVYGGLGLSLNDNYNVGDSIYINLEQISSNRWKGNLYLNENHSYDFEIFIKNGEEYLMLYDKPNTYYKKGDLLRIDTFVFIITWDTVNLQARFILAKIQEPPAALSLRNQLGGDVVYYNEDITSTTEKLLLYDFIAYTLTNDYIVLYNADKKLDNTGKVFYPINIGNSFVHTAFLGIRRYFT